MRNHILYSGQYVHVFNRGVDKRKIFSSDADRQFFLKRMNEYLEGVNGDLDVKLHAYCLMGNHFHLLLEQVSESGIAKYMHRLCSSYVRYYNRKIVRTGRLFEREYKSVSIEREGQLARVIRYIHMNPAESAICNQQVATDEIIQRARNYRWSDCALYLKGKGSLSNLFPNLGYHEFLTYEIWSKREDILQM